MKINLMFLPNGEFGVLVGDMPADMGDDQRQSLNDALLASKSAIGAKFILATEYPLEPEGFAALGDASHGMTS